MPKYKKIRIEKNTGALESDARSGLSTKTHVETPLKKGFSDYNPFKPILTITEDSFPIGFIVTSATGLLNGERVLVGGNGIIITDNGPNNTIEIGLSLSTVGISVLEGNSLVGQTAKLNFLANNIEISASVNSALSTIDITFSAKPVSNVVIDLVTQGGGIAAISTSGTEITQYTFAAGGGLDIKLSGNTIIYSAASFSPSLSLSSLGLTGQEVIAFVSALEINQRKIRGGGNTEVKLISDEIVISSKDTTIPSLQLSSRHTGITFIESVSSHQIIQRPIEGKGIVEARISADVVVLSAGGIGGNTISAMPAGVSPIYQTSANEVTLKSFEDGNGIVVVNRVSSISFDNVWINANNNSRFAQDPVASGSNAVAIGHRTISVGTNSFTLGTSAYNLSNNSIVMGVSAYVSSGSEKVVIGNYNHVTGNVDYVYIMGLYHRVEDEGGDYISIGLFDGDGSDVVNVGFNASDARTNFPSPTKNYMFGNYNYTGYNNSILIGTLNSITFDVPASAEEFNILIGDRNHITGEGGGDIGIGIRNEIAGYNNVVIGLENRATWDDSYVIGIRNDTYHRSTFFFGKNLFSVQDSAVYIGIDDPTLFISSSKFVGIGTTDPQAKLHVQDSSSDAEIILENPIGSAAISLGSAGSFTLSNNYPNGIIIFSLNNRARFNIDDEGFTYYNGDIENTRKDFFYKIVLLQSIVSAGQTSYLNLTTESGGEIVVPVSGTYGFHAEIVAKEMGTQEGLFHTWKGIIMRQGSSNTVSFITPPLQNIDGETADASEWNTLVSARSTDATLVLKFSTVSARSRNVKVFATVKLYGLEG